MFWNVIGVTAAVLTTFGFLPQILKMWRTKSAEDVSGLMLIQYGAGIAFWIFYGIHLTDWIIIGANVISLATILIAVGLHFKLSHSNDN